MVRGLAHEGRLLSIRITTPDRPGVLGDISTLIGSLGGNILEVSHHRLFLNVPAKGTTLDVTMETHDRTHAQEILAALESRDFSVRMLDLGESRL
jgi:threonine dehydratase